MQNTKDASVIKNEDENHDLLPGYKNLEEYTKAGYKILTEAIRNSNILPMGNDFNYYSTLKSFSNIMDRDSKNILKLANTVLAYQKVQGNIRSNMLEQKTDLIIQANDMLFEKVANNIDEMNGIKKTVNEPVQMQTVSARLPVNGAWNNVNTATFSVNSLAAAEKSTPDSDSIHLLAAKNIIRPQSFFKDKIVNDSNVPWEPRIKEKPNSLKPLAIFLEVTEHGEEYSHAYEFELEKFTPPPEQLVKQEVSLPKPIEETPLIEISEPEQINSLLDDLMQCKEFAVDLEHHSYRSFMGITCLMQISTKDKDYIIDTIALRDKLYLLNEVFTKPTILKIFHGANMDIVWLQRDLSLYVVNMFDTYQAAKALNFTSLSLAYLMKRYCNIVADKKFQLADWRIRPLPEELKKYAREDTHYLIYIYEMMKNDLLEKSNGEDNLLRSVINSSTETCKLRYLKPVFKENSYMDFYRKCNRLFDNRQLYALKELYKWRDTIARDQDESTGYVLPNHMMLQIAQTLPREMQGILACCSPIPPLVKSNLLELHNIVNIAREQSLEKPIFHEDTRARGAIKKVCTQIDDGDDEDDDGYLKYPHDLSKDVDFNDNLPTLLGGKTNNLEKCFDTVAMNIPTLSVFSTKNFNGKNKSLNPLRNILGPYERYKLSKPFIQSEERRLEAEKKAKEEQIAKESTNESAEVDPNFIQEKVEHIKQHFLSLSKISSDERIEDRKRKREDSSEDVIEIDPGSTNNELHGENFIKFSDDNQHESKRPRISPDVPYNQRKWQHFIESGQFSHNKFEVDRPIRKRRNNKKKQQQQQQQQQHQQQQQQQQQNNEQVNNSTTQRNMPKKRPNKNKKNKAAQNANSNRNQNQSNFTPYDYTSVDFNQFQGGAQEVQNPKRFNSKFKSKQTKRSRNWQNKSSNYKGSNNPNRGVRQS